MNPRAREVPIVIGGVLSALAVIAVASWCIHGFALSAYERWNADYTTFTGRTDAVVTDRTNPGYPGSTTILWVSYTAEGVHYTGVEVTAWSQWTMVGETVPLVYDPDAPDRPLTEQYVQESSPVGGVVGAAVASPLVVFLAVVSVVGILSECRRRWTGATRPAQPQREAKPSRPAAGRGSRRKRSASRRRR